MSVQDNFTAIVPPYAAAEGFQHFPRLSTSSGMNARVSQKQQHPLPAISISPTELTEFNEKKIGSVKQLLTRNGHMSTNEEEDLIKELSYILPFVDKRQLDSMRNDLSNCDPHQRKLVDAAVLQRVILGHLKQFPEHIHQKLTRLFANDPKKPRSIDYEELMDYLVRIKGYADELSRGAGKGQASPVINGSSKAESPFYQRGDAKLILELELSMKEFSIFKIDVPALRKDMSAMDKENTGTLPEKELERILNKHGLLQPLKRPLRHLLARCEVDGEKIYDWSTFLRFLEKAEPVRTVVPSDVTTKKEPMELEPGYPMIAKIGAGSANIAKAPKSEIPFDSGNRTGRQLAHDVMRKKGQKGTAEGEDKEKRPGTHSELPPIQKTRVSPAGTDPGDRLIEELKKLEALHHGYMPITTARSVIGAMMEQSQLGFNPRFVNSVITMCTNDQETHVNVRDIINYMGTVVSKQP